MKDRPLFRQWITTVWPMQLYNRTETYRIRLFRWDFPLCATPAFDRRIASARFPAEWITTVGPCTKMMELKLTVLGLTWSFARFVLACQHLEYCTTWKNAE